jgi:prepilin-type N-terminal cleavage/methylation domain-containing protein
MSRFSLKYPSRRAFTLVEWVVVVVILGILASLVTFYFYKIVAKSEESEALVNLAAIRRSELMVQTQSGTFVNASDTSEVNAKLSDQVISEKIFRYKVIDATLDNFTAIAERINAEKWHNQPTVFSMYANGLVSVAYSGAAGYGSSGGAGAGGSGGYGGGASGSGGVGGFGSSGGESGGAGGSGGSIVIGSSLPQIIDGDLTTALQVLRTSQVGGPLYDLIMAEDISVVFVDLFYDRDSGSLVLGQWVPGRNTIEINSVMVSEFHWTSELLATTLAHEATHADYSYNPEKWVDLTLERHPELTASDLHIMTSPWNSIDQEYNANIAEVGLWNEKKGSQTDIVLDYKASKMDEGESAYKTWLKEIPAYASLPAY